MCPVSHPLRLCLIILLQISSFFPLLEALTQADPKASGKQKVEYFCTHHSIKEWCCRLHWKVYMGPSGQYESWEERGERLGKARQSFTPFLYNARSFFSKSRQAGHGALAPCSPTWVPPHPRWARHAADPREGVRGPAQAHPERWNRSCKCAEAKENINIRKKIYFSSEFT